MFEELGLLGNVIILIVSLIALDRASDLAITHSINVASATGLGKTAKIYAFRIDFDSMKSRLNSLIVKYAAGLIIPVKGSDLESPALRQSITELDKCDYLKKLPSAYVWVQPRLEGSNR